MVFQIFWTILSGAVTDKLGRKRTTLLFDIISWGVPGLIWAIAQDFTYFLVAAIVNSLWRIVDTSWQCLLVEDTDPDLLVDVWALIQVGGLLAGLLEGFADDAGVLGVRAGLQISRQVFGCGPIGPERMGQEPPVPPMLGRLGQLDEVVAGKHRARVVPAAAVCVLEIGQHADGDREAVDRLEIARVEHHLCAEELCRELSQAVAVEELSAVEGILIDACRPADPNQEVARKAYALDVHACAFAHRHRQHGTG